MLPILLAIAAATELLPEDHAWPLCGRITESPPPGWSLGDDCPADRIGSSLHTDHPLDATYGPERLANPVDHYGWHRGIDIPTACGTPVFAMADGLVMIDGVSPSYSSRIVRLRHGDLEACAGGCVHTEYQHLAGVAVEAGHRVRAGQLIGWTGFFGAGNDPSEAVGDVCARPHTDTAAVLHFEVRQAPADEPTSAWSQDAVHPVSLLPYDDLGADDVRVRFEHVGVRDPMAPTVVVTAQIVNERELDLDRVVLQVIDQGRAVWAEVPQPGNTPDAGGWQVRPTEIGFQEWNRSWTHKNATTRPWSSFGDCPYADAHGATFDADVHTEALHPADDRFMQFNGVTLWVRRFDQGNVRWSATVWFEDVVGTRRVEDLCLRAWAEDLHGHATAPATWGCRPALRTR